MVIIGDYEVGKIVGRGQFSWVSKAKHLTLNKRVVIKHAPWKAGGTCKGGGDHKYCHHAPASSCHAALLNEASLLKQISHPGIVAILDIIGGSLNSFHICLEDLGNLTLTKYVKKQAAKCLHLEDVVPICKQVSDGLLYLHNIGIIHRDVKPDNIMVKQFLGHQTTAKIIDLGLAAFHKEETLNTSDIRVGTLQFMAPELMVENNFYGPKIDVFGLGASLYFGLFGEIPFEEFKRGKCRSTTAIFGFQSVHEEHLDSVSQSIRKLLRDMVNPDPVKRCSISVVCEHKWEIGCISMPNSYFRFNQPCLLEKVKENIAPELTSHSIF